jgi:hypothetical protein
MNRGTQVRAHSEVRISLTRVGSSPQNPGMGNSRLFQSCGKEER